MLDSDILMLYNHSFNANAPTIMENVNSFKKYSNYSVHNVNVFTGFPKNLNKITFKIIIVHYSSFSSLSPKFFNYIKEQKNSIKIAFFQDEHHNCTKRFNLINNLDIKVVYTMLEKDYHYIYRDNTNAEMIYHNLTGYVDDGLVSVANSLYKKIDQRKIDIGYRARPLPFYMGKGAQEKTRIAEEFNNRLFDSKLVLDVKTKEKDRIYGKAWHHFIANCKGMLGVEAGTSIFDIDGKAEKACEEYLLNNPNALFEKVHDAVLKPFEDNIYYRTISPRIFECAAFKTCMILFEGSYNDIIEPEVHYIPLKKDFSNFDWVMSIFNDPNKREHLVENTYRDLIKSQKYSYKKFIKHFDAEIEKLGINHDHNVVKKEQITEAIKQDKWVRVGRIKALHFINHFITHLYLSLPYRKHIKNIIKPIIKRFIREKKFY
jgi:hypothetical protein